MTLRPMRPPLRGRAALCGLAFVAGSASAVAQDVDGTGWELHARYEHHLDGAPLSLFDSDRLWQAMQPRPGRNLAFVDDEVAAGRRSGDWVVSLLARERGEVIANRDALDLARVIDDGDNPSTSRRWNGSAQAFAFVGGGIGLERSWRPAAPWRLRTGVQALALGRVIDRRISGWGAYDASTGNYSADLQSWQADDRLRYPYQREHASMGQALLSDGELAWQAMGSNGDGPRADGARVALRWQDVGLLQWRALPQQQETLSNQMTYRDANGFVVYQPLIQGRNTQTLWRRWSVPVTELEADVPTASAGRWVLASRYLPGFGALPRIGARQTLGAWQLAQDWHLHERRAELGVERAGWRLSGGADVRASHRSLSWGIGWSSDGAGAR